MVPYLTARTVPLILARTCYAPLKQEQSVGAHPLSGRGAKASAIVAAKSADFNVLVEREGLPSMGG